MNTAVAGGEQSAGALLRWQFALAHRLLDAALEGLSPELAHRRPSGAAVPAGACYAQIVVCEDLSVNGVLAAGTPLALSTRAGRTGLSELPPVGRAGQWRRAWARRVRLDLAEVQLYAQAVYAATDAYLATLADAALDPAQGGQTARLLSAVLLTLAMRRGEIACLLALERWPAQETTPTR
jgi:hypothetical protein